MPPSVQNLSDIIASLNSTYDPQRTAVNQQIDQTNTAESQATAGFNAAKDTAFQGIQNTANSRGMLFSGFTPDQQAKYTASTYLPALVNLHSKTADNISKLQQNILSLNTAQNSQATGIQQNQQQQLNDYNINQQKLAQEVAIAQMKAQAQIQAASIRSSGGGSVTATQQRQADASSLFQQLSGKAGSDGYISPATYAAGLQAWQSAGYTQKDYDATFSGLRNPNNKHYRLTSGWGS